MEIKLIDYMYLFDGYSLFRMYRKDGIAHFEELSHYGNWHDVTDYSYLIEGNWWATPNQAIKAKQDSIDLSIEEIRQALKRYYEK